MEDENTILVMSETQENPPSSKISEDTENIITENEKSPEMDSSETSNIDIETANNTNCLALTIQKEHKLVAVKNVFVRSLRMTWKVVLGTIALNILRLFS